MTGSGSYDPDQRPAPLTYLWKFVSRPAASRLSDDGIQDATTATPSFVPDVDGVYVLSLTVNDGSSSTSDNVAVTAQTDVTVNGGAYFYHGGYQEKISLDVTVLSGMVQSTGWLKYYYTKTRMNLVSTKIQSVSIVGNVATVSGMGAMNGTPGYSFVATVTNGLTGIFGITINKPDGTLYYKYSDSMTGGELFILH